MTPPILATSIATDSPASDFSNVCSGNIRQNRLFQLAGSPQDSSSALDVLDRLVDRAIDDPENEDGKLRVSKTAGKGLTCFQLARIGFGSLGVISILVFNKDKQITRW